MANTHKDQLLANLQERFGPLGRLAGSQSLFSLREDAARVYVRYSRFHDGNKAFFGLRRIDLLQLAGQNSYICFLVDGGLPPVLVPYGDFEEVFRDAETASDGQYKVQLLNTRGQLELYVARQGRFNVNAYVGFDLLEKSIDARGPNPIPDLTHSQVQTMLAGIGNCKGYDVWIPASTCAGLNGR